jgi:hypothetical protein
MWWHAWVQAKQELPNMQGALERTHDNQYHLYNVDGYANTITEGAKVIFGESKSTCSTLRK